MDEARNREWFERLCCHVSFLPGHSISFHQDNRHINTYSVEPRSVDLHPKIHMFQNHIFLVRYEIIISDLCENLDSLDEPDAKAAMIWIVGEYAERHLAFQLCGLVRSIFDV